jgi:hypothetical protein
MTLPLRPKRGGFLRAFGCGIFIKYFLLGTGPHGSPKIDPNVGAPQADIFREYKSALMRVTALDRATRVEEKRARREKRRINPDNIESLTRKYLEKIPYKTIGCRYNSFVHYFAMPQALEWVERSGIVEPSEFQENYAKGQPRIFYRLTDKGKSAPDYLWANPHKALYGY